MQPQNDPMPFSQLHLAALQKKTTWFNAVFPLAQSNTSNCAASAALLGMGLRKVFKWHKCATVLTT